MNIATRKEYNTGRSGEYGTDDITGVNYSLNSNMYDYSQYGKVNESFLGGMTGEQLLGYPNYCNPMNNIHNNIGPDVLIEQNMNNKIFIDAEYRDTSYVDSYNQPFKFTVRFRVNETTPYPDFVSFEYNDIGYTYPVYKNGARDIIFPYVYHNINFIMIDNLIMPSYLEYQSFDDGSIRHVSGRNLSKTEKYLVLKIEQLNNHLKISNNPKIGDNCFIMKHDLLAGINHGFYVPIHDVVTSYESQLSSLDRLDIEICDHKGNILWPTLDGKRVNFHKLYIDTIEELRDAVEHEKKNKKNDCEHKNKKKIDKLELRALSLRHIVDNIDPEIHMTVNNVNQQINTRHNYRR